MLVLVALVACKKEEAADPIDEWLTLDPDPPEIEVTLESDQCGGALGFAVGEVELTNVSEKALHLFAVTPEDQIAIEAAGGLLVTISFPIEGGTDFQAQVQLEPDEQVLSRLDARIYCATNNDGTSVAPDPGAYDSLTTVQIKACPGSSFCEEATNDLGEFTAAVALALVEP